LNFRKMESLKLHSTFAILFFVWFNSVNCQDELNKFALESTRSLAENEFKDKNFVYSPFSLNAAISMVIPGAKGKTLSQLKEALNLQKLDNEAIGQLFKNLFTSLKTTKSNDVTLLISNRGFVDKTLSILNPFQQFLTKYHDSKFQNVDFKSQPKNAAKEINKWASDSTKGIIDNIVSEDSVKDLVLLLGNAVYFKGKWMFKFDKKDTKDEDFYTDEVNKKKVPMMRTKKSFNYVALTLNGEKLQALEMHYTDRDYSMIILLPESKSKSALGNVLKGLDEKVLQEKIISKFVNQTVNVRIPRFEIKSDMDLIPTMKKMKVTDLFNNNADLSGISATPLLVSLIKQVAKIEVNEEGTVAAAVTGSQFIALSAAPRRETNFIANRPFAYFLVNGEFRSKSKTILFSGIVQEY